MVDHAPPGGGPNRRAVALAGHLGDTAVARAAAADPDPAVRATALRALARSGDLRPEDLRVALADTDPGVRRRALTILAETGPPGAMAAALPLLDDPDPGVVEVAAWALGELPAEAGRRRLVAALAEVAGHHPDALCRESAVAALAAVGHPDGLAAVLAALRDKPAVRRRAVVALAAFDDPRADAALALALHDRDRQVRETAEELFAVPSHGVAEQGGDGAPGC